jgi:predicted PurR-regulated permease PerM
MFGLDVRMLRKVWTVFLFALVVLLIYRTGRTIAIFALAVFLAHLLGPIAEQVERIIPQRRISRNISLAIVFSLLIVLISTVLVPIASQVGQQAASLASRLPEALNADPLANLSLPVWLEPLRDRVTAMLRASMADFDTRLIPILKDAGANIASLVGSALAMILIPILSFLFLLDSAGIQESLIDLFPAANRDVAEEILQDLHRLLAEYIRALVVLAFLVLVIFSLFLYGAGVSYAILLASLAAVLEIIPFAGPLAAGAIIMLVALLTGYPHMVGLFVFLVAFRVVQDYVISPKLLSSGVELHPLLVLFGVLAGEQIAGIPGMFFSVPILAALRIIVVRMRRKNVKADVVLQ